MINAQISITTPNITTREELLASYYAELHKFRYQVIDKQLLHDLQLVHRKYMELQKELKLNLVELSQLFISVNGLYFILYKDELYTPIDMLQPYNDLSQIAFKPTQKDYDNIMDAFEVKIDYKHFSLKD